MKACCMRSAWVTVQTVTGSMEGAEASNGDNNRRVEEARRARVEWLLKLQRESASEEEFDTARSQPTWTELDVTPFKTAATERDSTSSSSCASSSSSCASYGLPSADLEHRRYENRCHFRHLLNLQSPGSQSRLSIYGDEDPNRLGSHLFFIDCGGRLEAGKKIGGGGQADIHRAIYEGKQLEDYVLKVFKNDYSFADLERFWMSTALFRLEYENARDFGKSNICFIQHGTLMRDERFAFVMRLYWGDLRKAIDLAIMKDRSHQRPPFSHLTTCKIMYSIAGGMKILHEGKILHKDLKAANCLLQCKPQFWRDCSIADFQGPEGVIGTGFWRAPEVLLAIKMKQHSNQEVWTEKVDVYGYAMTFYEILTGCTPFEGRAIYDYEGVINGERPPLPDYVDPRLGDLVRSCWHSEPLMRPTFTEIRQILEGITNNKVRMHLHPWHQIRYLKKSRR